MSIEKNDEDLFKEIFNVAVRLLARREHSCFELTQKLLARDYTQDQIAKIIQQLLMKNVISDERFTESYCRYRSQKGFGPVRINMELQQRGVNAELVADRLAILADDWLAIAKHVRQKRFGSKLPGSFAERAKQMRFLQYRGFSVEQINQVFVRVNSSSR